jgi:hypothetical protein
MGDYCALTSNAGYIKGIKIGTATTDTLTEEDRAECEDQATDEINGRLGVFATGSSTPSRVTRLALLWASAQAVKMHARSLGRDAAPHLEYAKSLEDRFEAAVKGLLEDGEIIPGHSVYGGQDTKGMVIQSDFLDSNGDPKKPIFNETGVDGIGDGIREDVDTDSYTVYDTPGD